MFGHSCDSDISGDDASKPIPIKGDFDDALQSLSDNTVVSLAVNEYTSKFVLGTTVCAATVVSKYT